MAGTDSRLDKWRKKVRLHRKEVVSIKPENQVDADASRLVTAQPTSNLSKNARLPPPMPTQPDLGPSENHDQDSADARAEGPVIPDSGDSLQRLSTAKDDLELDPITTDGSKPSAVVSKDSSLWGQAQASLKIKGSKNVSVAG